MKNSKKPSRIINKIKFIRKNNNDLWMRILQIAVESNPKEARKILRGINQNDKKVTRWLEKL